MITGLTIEDSHTIGFVAARYFKDAIDTAELNKWAEHIMVSAESADDCPSTSFICLSLAKLGATSSTSWGFHPTEP